MSLAMRSEAWAMSEVPFLLLLFLGSGRIVIDDPPLPLGALRQQHLLDDLWKRGRLTLDGSRQRITPKCTEAHAPHPGLLTGTQRHTLIVDHDEGSIALHN